MEVSQISFSQIILILSVPSAFTGFLFWLLERKITKREEAREKKRQEEMKDAKKREDARELYEIYLMKIVQASLSLGEATAEALARIPDAKCNGDMHSALEYARKVKHEQKDFLNEQAIRALQN